MSLARLLAAGKSLVGLKGAEDHYQLPSRPALPTFVAKKNPFRGEKSGSQDASVSTPVNVVSSAALANRPAPEPATAVGRPVSRNGWFSAVRRLLAVRNREISKPRLGRKSHRLVQAELSLETVKVMRNDLVESDLEIVPAAAVQGAVVAPMEEAGVSGAPVSDCQPELLAESGHADASCAAPEATNNSKAVMPSRALVGRLFGPGKAQG